MFLSLSPSLLLSLKLNDQTSSQDGGIGRYTLPPHTNNQKKDNNKFKNKNNQNCQEIELYGSLTTKELTFIQTSRRGEHGQPGWRELVARWQQEIGAGKVVIGRVGGPTFACG